MSQFPFPPPPYSPPMVDPRAWAMAQPHAAGRAAALWQIILGALILVVGAPVLLAVFVLPDDAIVQMIQQSHSNLPPMPNFSPAQEFRLGMSLAAGFMMLVAAALLLLGIFVRRGGKVSSIFSIVLISIISLIVLINVVVGLTQAAGHPEAIFSLALFAGVLTLCGVTIAKLAVAVGSSGTAQMQAMQQAYYWMMQQQQAGGHGQGGYGYGQNIPPGGAATEPTKDRGGDSPAQ